MVGLSNNNMRDQHLPRQQFPNDIQEKCKGQYDLSCPNDIDIIVRILQELPGLFFF